eukprot:scaffold12145_cov139-Amphora_coffeaeformis.AAC.6
MRTHPRFVANKLPWVSRVLLAPVLLLVRFGAPRHTMFDSPTLPTSLTNNRSRRDRSSPIPTILLSVWGEIWQGLR